jgi:diguanylate cyclase (GGDEF)-like protein
MPIALYLTLISLGLFLLTTIFYGALAAFSESRFFFILISFSVSCVLFSVIESVHILLPENNFGLIGVQIFYMLIVLMNPVLLLGILNQNGSIRSFLIGLLITNGILFVTIVSAAFIDSSLLNIDISAGRLTIGPFRYLRVIAAILNWLIALALVVSRVRRRTENTVHYYLIVGYVLLVAGSLLDVFILSRAIPKGRMSQGFYPGLILGLMAFHTFVTLYLSRSYRDREKESRLNVHAMEESKKELMRMAYYDDMTGRPNRKSFLLHLNHHIIETLSLGKTKAVFLLDLDNFRDINDTFGYSYGDLVIKNVGEKIEDRFGVRDRLYRLYGNQFAIIWDEIRDRGHALDTATAILDDLTSLVEIDASNLYMGVSLGVVMLPEDGDDVNEVFRRCETALAEAKKDKNTFFFYSSELESRTQKKMSIVNSLREALSKEQFEVVYQPIVESDGRLAEMEALIRCNHPNLKETSPEVFISVAESSGLIIPLTWWLMDHVAKEAVKFAAKARDVRININMSPKILKSRIWWIGSLHWAASVHLTVRTSVSRLPKAP